LKKFQYTGNFFEDIRRLCNEQFKIKIHPAIREDSYAQQLNSGDNEDEEVKKEVCTLTFYKHRLDRATQKVLFTALPHAPHIHTLKFSNNGFSHSQFKTLVEALSVENSPVVNLFFDWNPIYKDGFKAGVVPDGTN